MKLLTKADEKKLTKANGKENPVALVKFFAPWSNWTWYASEYDPETGLFFGLVSGFEMEFGYFSLDELQNVRGKFGLKIEKDRFYTSESFEKIKERGY